MILMLAVYNFQIGGIKMTGFGYQHVSKECDAPTVVTPTQCKSLCTCAGMDCRHLIAVIHTQMTIQYQLCELVIDDV